MTEYVEMGYTFPRTVVYFIFNYMCYSGHSVFRTERQFNIKASLREVYQIYLRDNIITDT